MKPFSFRDNIAQRACDSSQKAAALPSFRQYAEFFNNVMDLVSVFVKRFQSDAIKSGAAKS